MHTPATLAVGFAVFAALAAGTRAQPVADPIDLVPIASLTFDGGTLSPWQPPIDAGRPGAIHDILRLPPGTARVPGVVLLHGCLGVGEGDIAWARRLRDRGIATLIVNSFTGRGIASVCRGTQSLNAASALVDAYRALDVLAAHPRIDPTRIAVVGFSSGGRTALWTAHPRLRERYAPGSVRFAAHVAFYPASCFIHLEDEPARAGVPILVLEGGDDDWTPAAACRGYVERLRAAGEDAALVTYAGARHGFDVEALRGGRVADGVLGFAGCSFVERGGAIVDLQGRPADDEAPCIRRRTTVGYDEGADRQAQVDLQRFLDRVLGLR